MEKGIRKKTLKAHCLPNGSNASCQTGERGKKAEQSSLRLYKKLEKVTSTRGGKYFRKLAGEFGNVQNLKLYSVAKNKLIQR